MRVYNDSENTGILEDKQYRNTQNHERIPAQAPDTHHDDHTEHPQAEHPPKDSDNVKLNNPGKDKRKPFPKHKTTLEDIQEYKGKTLDEGKESEKSKRILYLIILDDNSKSEVILRKNYKVTNSLTVEEGQQEAPSMDKENKEFNDILESEGNANCTEKENNNNKSISISHYNRVRRKNKVKHERQGLKAISAHVKSDNSGLDSNNHMEEGEIHIEFDEKDGEDNK